MVCDPVRALRRPVNMVVLALDVALYVAQAVRMALVERVVG